MSADAAAHHVLTGLQSDAPEVEIRNVAGGARIEVVIHDPMSAQFWDELEHRLLRVVRVRQPSELLLELHDADASDPAPGPERAPGAERPPRAETRENPESRGRRERLQRLASAVHEFGGELLVTSAAPTGSGGSGRHAGGATPRER